MHIAGFEIRCPHCRGELGERSGGAAELRCAGCDRAYPVVLGIPDLRVFPDPYIDVEADREKGLRVAERFDDTNFVELVEFYYSITEVVPPHHARQYARGLLAGEARARAALDEWETTAGRNEDGPARTFLDVGCGTAPLLLAAAPTYKQLVGVDIAFRWLVVAKKRLAEAGLSIPLICACAEALPFADGAFDRVAGESALEHTRDQPQALAEAYRVLRPGGRLFLSTPNRFSLGPDPQTGVWAGGYLPESWQAARVRRQGGIPPVRRLLSARAVAGLVKEAGFRETNVGIPDIPEGQRRHFGRGLRMLIDIYQLAKRLPLIKQTLLWIGPLLFVVARKPLGEDA